MSTVKIVHLSDTHLGNDYVFRSLLRKRAYWNTEDEKLLRNLTDAIRKIGPDYVIHTGDVVNKSTSSNFTHAADRLRTLFENGGVDVKRRVLIIPGNHDVKVLAGNHEYWGRLEGFHHFLKWFFDETDYQSRSANFVVTDLERKLWIFCLDSTLKEKYQFAEGEIGQGQWDWFSSQIETLKKVHLDHEQFVKIVALHHHPHPIRSGGQERFMQLLDAGKAIAEFKRHGVNLVLHGHKHFPHVLTEHYGEVGQHHYTVVGAGTATCPFPEEQSGEGNNFNLIIIKPEANSLGIQRWKANNDKVFEPVSPEPELQPVFRASPSGYRISRSTMINRILDANGTCVVTHKRVGVSVDRKDFSMGKILFGMGADPPTTEVGDLNYDDDVIETIEYEDNKKNFKKGYFILRNPVRQGMDPINLWHTYEIKGAFCTRRADYQNYYPGNQSNEEKVEMEVVHVCDELTLVVEFPHRYKVSPRPRAITNNGQEISLNSGMTTYDADRLANRFTLHVRRPELQARYRLAWQVPD